MPAHLSLDSQFTSAYVSARAISNRMFCFCGSRHSSGDQDNLFEPRRQPNSRASHCPEARNQPKHQYNLSSCREQATVPAKGVFSAFSFKPAPDNVQTGWIDRGMTLYGAKLRTPSPQSASSSSQRRLAPCRVEPSFSRAIQDTPLGLQSK